MHESNKNKANMQIQYKNKGAFFFLGAGIENKENRIFAHHDGYFQLDERCLLVGGQILVNLILDRLKP